MKGIIIELISHRLEVYISDSKLYSQEKRKEVVDELLKIKIEEFSLEEWNYSLSYILNSSVNLNSILEVEKYLAKLKK